MYKKVGEKLDYKDMIKSVANPPAQKKKSKIKIDSAEVDSSAAGIYNVYYYQTLDGKNMSMTRLVVCYED